MSEPKNAKNTIECLYKFYGKPNERIQLFYEDFDLYYPYDINKFNKIELVLFYFFVLMIQLFIFSLTIFSCRYADSICLKFYENDRVSKPIIKQPNHLTNTSKLMNTIGTTTQSNNNDIISLENHHYDICNCINVSFIPRQIMSASNFIQVRFKTVPRTSNNLNYYRGYLIRYKFITSNFKIK